MSDMKFDWDVEKEQINIEKHGISFLTATRVFFDENRIEIYDFIHSKDEDRYVTIGAVDDGAFYVLFVVYTERREVIRLISARKAMKSERRLYDQNRNGS